MPQSTPQPLAKHMMDLPPEIVTMICQFIRSTTYQKNVCLIDRRFRDIMLPFLWGSFSSNLRPGGRQLLALLSPTSNILKFVRKFTFWQPVRSENSWEVVEQGLDQATCATLTRFWTALPRDQLSEFHSNQTIDTTIAQVLLQTHRKLKVLRAPLPHYNGWDDEPGLHLAPWTQALLGSLESLEVNAQPLPLETPSGVRQQSLENYRFLIKHTPSLKSLAIQVARWDQLAVRRPPMKDIIFTGQEGIPQQLNLDELSLSFLDFDGENILLQEVDFLNLRKLKFKWCRQEVPLLIEIAKVFARGNPRLEILEIDSPEEPLDSNQGEQTVHAIEQLLDSFTGLKALYIDYNWLPRMVATGCITRHAATLEVLSVGSGSTIHHFSTKDLEAMLTSCSKLTQLGICLLPGEELNEWYTYGSRPLRATSNSFDVQSELEITLETISKHPKLTVLRMLNDPSVRWREPTYSPGFPGDEYRLKLPNTARAALTATIVQNFATHVLRFLDGNDSRIKLFVVSQYRLPLRAPPYPIIDVNGHQYPRYTYTKGRAVDGLGRSSVVAVPFEEPKREMPEVSILWHEFEEFPISKCDDASYFSPW